MGQRALLFLTSLVLVLSVLESAARLFVSSQGPVWLRDGIYLNPLPLVTGVVPQPMRRFPRGLRLPERKPSGEVRIFVFGESSVEGAPLDANASAPTMLYDMLVKAYPDRAIKVINMGRTASICASAYYYLLYARRYDPDFLIFYMGMNDGNMPGEQRWPVSRPGFHRLWRGLMGKSQLFWCARVFVPPFLWSLRPPKRPNRNPAQVRDPAQGPGALDPFPRWADLLVTIAAETGAKVIVTTPVRSAVSQIEPPIHSLIDAGEKSIPMTDDYRRLLACRLTDTCDFIALFKAMATGKPGGRSDGDLPMVRHMREVDARAKPWQSAAERNGADFIDFHAALEKASPHRVVADRYFADEIHLSPEGYCFLARSWFERIKGYWDGTEPREPKPPVYDDVKDYYKAVKNTGTPVFMMYLAKGWFLTAIPGLEMISQRCPGGKCDELAAVALGWLRQKAGLPPKGSREFSEKVKAFDAPRMFSQRLKVFTPPRKLRY
ncbi:MAG: SGNH/GDSL hydrolase family protein [Elusimicrobia bacterium]|nr:SGNH/GDSL hydrolase family protein [Elusimicrobiota bacterium]